MSHKECPECNGWGYATYEREVYATATGYRYIEEYTDDCQNCKGYGQIEYTPEDEDDEYLQYDPPGAAVIILMMIGMAFSFSVIVYIFVKELL